MRGFPKGYYKHSEEIKRKISGTLKGKSKPWAKGKPSGASGKRWYLSAEARRKMSESHKGMRYSKERNKKVSESRKKIMTEELKERISKSESGKNHWNWEGGQKRYKHSCIARQYKKWRLAVFTKDNFTCVNCQKVGGYLIAHHAKGWAKYPKLRYKINNGITLCKNCHSLTDNYKGKAVKLKWT